MGSCSQIIAGHLLVVLFVSVLQTCSARYPNLTLLELPDIVGVWDRSLYQATQFRNDSVVGYFDIWPENSTITKFKYYCEDPGKGYLSLSNFTYSLTEGRLDPRPYYDLGIVDSYQPYWKHWEFWKVDTKRLSYPINCEFNDVHDLYFYRFLKMTLPRSFAAAAVMQGIIQFIVTVVVTLRWGWMFYKCYKNPKDCEQNLDSKKKPDMKKKLQRLALELLECWFFSSHWGDFFSELIHLGCLVVAGYCMMEAIGHGDLHTWRPTVMYNTGVIYSWLSLFAVLSSVFRQIAYSWMEPVEVKHFEERKEANTLSGMDQKFWYDLQNISDDWRWQRVFGQLGVVVLMGTYLTFVDDRAGSGMDQLAGLVLAAIVVACIWSFEVTAVVSFRSFKHILAQVFRNKFVKLDVRIIEKIQEHIPSWRRTDSTTQTRKLRLTDLKTELKSVKTNIDEVSKILVTKLETIKEDIIGDNNHGDTLAKLEDIKTCMEKIMKTLNTQASQKLP